MVDVAALESDYIDAATALTWTNVSFRNSVTSFRDPDAASEYRDRIRIRFGVEAPLWQSDHIPGYEPDD